MSSIFSPKAIECQENNNAENLQMLNTVSGSLVQKGKRSLTMRISLLRRHCWS